MIALFDFIFYNLFSKMRKWIWTTINSVPMLGARLEMLAMLAADAEDKGGLF